MRFRSGRAQALQHTNTIDGAGSTGYCDDEAFSISNHQPPTLKRLSSLHVFRRKREGSVICAYCGVLVGVNDDRCYNCGRRNPGLWGYGPALRALGQDFGFVPFAIGTCVILWGLSLVASGGNIGMRGLFSLLSPSTLAMVMFGASGALPVFGLGRWWTVLSAGWLHWGVLHLAFNMMALRQLGPATVELYGPGRTAIIYTAGSVIGFTLSSVAGAYLPQIPFLSGAAYTAGASAPIAGLIGAIYHYGNRGGSSMARSYATSYIMGMVFYALFLPGIDNWAHAGGLAGGYLAAVYLDPLKPERIGHLLTGLVCIVLSLVAVLVSVVSVLSLRFGR
jgi:rhomboid protease GluP